MKAIDNKELILSLEELEKEKGIKKEYVIEAIETALVTAYKRNFDSLENVKVDIDKSPPIDPPRKHNQTTKTRRPSRSRNSTKRLRKNSSTNSKTSNNTKTKRSRKRNNIQRIQ